MPTPRRLGRLALLAALALAAGLLLGAPATATYPGPDGRIAFDDFNTGQLYSINPDGSGLRQLTSLPEGSFAFAPDWSPDSRQIAFSSNLGGGDLRMYVIDRDSSHRRLVFEDRPGYGDLFPNWTPDGHRLVFQRCQPDDGVCAIYSVGVDGHGLRALTRFKTGINEANDFWPTVAADGRVAFGRFGAGGITSQVYVMSATGGGAHPVTPPALTAIPGEWTPDSQHLLVSSNGFRPNAAIYQVRPDGTGLRRLTRPAYPHNDVLPSPSPAGDRVVLSSDRRYPDVCCGDLYVMRTDGSGLHRVPTGDLNGIGNPDWGSAPPDTGSGATAAATAPRASARAGAGAPAARLCASLAGHGPAGTCGTQATGNKFAGR
jgi:Tol biopolymer transport system component